MSVTDIPVSRWLIAQHNKTFLFETERQPRHNNDDIYSKKLQCVAGETNQRPPTNVSKWRSTKWDHDRLQMLTQREARKNEQTITQLLHFLNINHSYLQSALLSR